MDDSAALAPRFRFRFSAIFTDSRIFQILSLGILFAGGVWFRDFSLRPAQIVLTFAAALATQRLTWRFYPLAARSYRSAIITSLSVTLLLRADSLFVHPMAAAAAIGSKSLIRVRGKHLFNPATFGVIFALVTLPGTWVSAGQWGHDVALAGWLVALGVLVTERARRGDISWSFLAFHLGTIALRVAWLGQRFAVWEHQLSNGALLLFAFFMISDPMTGPNHRWGRLSHSALVAAIAYWWQFRLYSTNGLIWALFVAAPMVPVWDLIWRAPKFEWNHEGENHGADRLEASDSTADRRGADARGVLRAA